MSTCFVNAKTRKPYTTVHKVWRRFGTGRT